MRRSRSNDAGGGDRSCVCAGLTRASISSHESCKRDGLAGQAGDDGVFEDIAWDWDRRSSSCIVSFKLQGAFEGIAEVMELGSQDFWCPQKNLMLSLFKGVRTRGAARAPHHDEHEPEAGAAPLRGARAQVRLSRRGRPRSDRWCST